MTLRFIDGLPVLGYLELDDRVLAFAWLWHEPTLRLTFTEGPSPLIGHVTHLDGIPRLTPAPDNLAWLHQDDQPAPGRCSTTPSNFGEERTASSANTTADQRPSSVGTQLRLRLPVKRLCGWSPPYRWAPAGLSR